MLGSAGVDDLYERLGLPEDEDIDSNTVNGLVPVSYTHLKRLTLNFSIYSVISIRTMLRSSSNSALSLIHIC